MSSEIPFHTSTLRSKQRFLHEAYSDVLPEYGNRLLGLATHIIKYPGNGLVTLGSSAKDMWHDLRQIAHINGLRVPRPIHITGDLARETYAGDLFAMEKAIQRSGITFKGKIIVEDYADRAKKIIKLDGLFKHLNFPVRFAVLYATTHALWDIADYPLPVHVVLEQQNPRLLNLLKTRKTDK